MIRHYCDSCGREVTKENECAGGPLYCKDRFGGEVVTKSGAKLKVEILTSLNGTANDGCFCRDCVVAAINELASPSAGKPALRALR